MGIPKSPATNMYAKEISQAISDVMGLQANTPSPVSQPQPTNLSHHSQSPMPQVMAQQQQQQQPINYITTPAKPQHQQQQKQQANYSMQLPTGGITAIIPPQGWCSHQMAPQC